MNVLMMNFLIAFPFIIHISVNIIGPRDCISCVIIISQVVFLNVWVLVSSLLKPLHLVSILLLLLIRIVSLTMFVTDTKHVCDWMMLNLLILFWTVVYVLMYAYKTVV